MAQRSNLVIPEVGKILQFPPPSPKEASRPSFRREAYQCVSPQKVPFPVDKFCSDIMEDTFTRIQKKKRLNIPSREFSMFRTNTEDNNRFFTVPSLSTEVQDKLRAEMTGPTSFP